MSMSRFAAVLAVLACAACAGQGPVRFAASTPAAPAAADPLAEAAARGRQFASGSCASCHAIGPTGASPLAAATPFRDIVRRRPLDGLEEGFAEGLVTAHPAMPALVFRASEIDDLMAYLETVRSAQ